MAGLGKKNKKKKWGCLVAILLVLAVAAAVFFIGRSAKQKMNAPSVYIGDLYTVSPRDVSDTVSATGLLESDEDTTAKVYSTMNYKIKTVSVKLGDKVSEGDTLCVYDTDALKRTIHERELSMSSSERAAAINLANAKRNYDTYAAGLADGTNTTLKNAQSALASAQDNYDKAKKDYDDYLAKTDSDAVLTLNAAKRNLDKAQKDYDEQKAKLEDESDISLNAALRRLESAKKDLDDFEEKVKNEKYTPLVNAKRTLDSAKESYDDYKRQMNNDETPELMSTYAASKAAYAAYRAAEAELDALEARKAAGEDVDSKIAKKEAETEKLKAAYYDADDAYDAAYSRADNTLKSLKAAYDNAQDSYDAALESIDDQRDALTEAVKSAQDNVDTLTKNLDDALENYARVLKDAEDNFTNAKENADKQLESYTLSLSAAERNLSDAGNALANAKISTADTLESYRNAYENAKNSADTGLSDYQLAGLYDDLDDAVVTAPISGTVTAVYAVEGESSSGVLFVVEDTENLVVTSTVKAYDLDKVAVGMRVKIKTDATGDEVFEGVIDSVAPTANKDASGNVLSTNDAEFATVVRVTDKSERLKIGVSARIEYVIHDAPQSTAVPEGAVLSDAEGDYVLTAETDETGKQVTLTKTPVRCGVSDGVYVSVEGVVFDTAVVDNAQNYIAFVGTTVPLSEIDKNANAFDLAAMMRGGSMPMGGM